jgi:hypothetical protein
VGHTRAVPTEPHNRILTSHARAMLRPMGLTQRGRSRTWQEDHGWWVLYVDFQPSGFAKATYLNVFLHWLWRLGEDRGTGLSMDLGNRVTGAGAFFEDEEQWTVAVEDVVARAIEEVHRYRALVPDVASAARACVRQEEARIADIMDRDGISRDEVSAGWPTWHAAVSSGLAGDVDAAEHYFSRIIRLADDRDFFVPYVERSREWLRLVRDDHPLFVGEVLEGVNLQRSRLKLPLLAGPAESGGT